MGGGSSQPVLYTIPFSHFCEAGRWALAEAKIDFTESGYYPGLHMMMGPMGRIRGDGSAVVPLLVDTDGSVLANDSWECLAKWEPVDERLKQILNEVVGPHVRSIVYSYYLPDDGAALAPLASVANMPFLQRTIFGLDGFRGVASKKMYKSMVKSDEYIAKCKQELAVAVQELEGSMIFRSGFTERADGRPTANAIAVASLFAPMVSPPNLGAGFFGEGGFPLTYETAPPGFQEEVKRWRATKLGTWTTDVYAKYYNHVRPTPSRL
mmetsp:Transcript_32617/g.59611  ORF Transcript_32617/g.59611 Transcript_32617/m.59611 type:complete len:266 (+) Transcript_32617:75-872(+)